MNNMSFFKKSLMLNINSAILGFFGLFLQNSAYAAVYQILSDYFYQNPAELSQIHETQLILGVVCLFIAAIGYVIGFKYFK